MSFKEAIIKCLKVAGWLLLAIIPFIAGIAAKEGAANGCELCRGWAEWAGAGLMAVLVLV